MYLLRKGCSSPEIAQQLWTYFSETEFFHPLYDLTASPLRLSFFALGRASVLFLLRNHRPHSVNCRPPEVTKSQIGADSSSTEVLIPFPDERLLVDVPPLPSHEDHSTIV